MPSDKLTPIPHVDHAPDETPRERAALDDYAAREAAKAPPVVDMLPGGTIIGFDLPDNMSERHARVLQAMACGVPVSEAGALVHPPMDYHAARALKLTHRALYDVYRARNEVIIRGLAKSGIVQSVLKMVDAVSSLPKPESWQDARLAGLVAEQFSRVLKAFDETPQTLTRQRADVAKALDRLKSVQAIADKQDADDMAKPIAQVDNAP